MKRLGVYLFFDPDGVVDSYVPYFLEKLKEHCDEIAVVVNGYVDDNGMRALGVSADKIFVRENKGFDSWAYKHVIEQYGYEALKQYDELLICNYTCFGPIYAFSELFDEMSTRDCDFWGVHRHPPQPMYQLVGRDIIEHLQSHFIVFRKSILTSDAFKNYWETLEEVTSYQEAIAFHELRCTPYFEERGFVSDEYLPSEKYFRICPNMNASIVFSYRQLVDERSPLLKRKVLFIGEEGFQFPLRDGHHNLDVVHYIAHHTDYDIGLIYENIVRTQNKAIIKLPFHTLKTTLKYHVDGVLANVLRWRRKKLRAKRRVYKQEVTLNAFASVFFGWRDLVNPYLLCRAKSCLELSSEFSKDLKKKR